TLGALVAPIYEALNSVSREFVGFIPGAQRDNGNFTRAAVGQKVTVPIVPPVIGADIVPGVTPPNDGDYVLGSTDLTITKSRA
ncbi:P22 coat - protein 5 family protein, partial [Klebsiella pneumoniae]